MTYRDNITAILECNFTGFKEEIIANACNRILELRPAPRCILKSDGTIEPIINCNDCVIKGELDQIKSYIEHIKNTGMGKKKSLEFIEKYIECLNAERRGKNERDTRKPH